VFLNGVEVGTSDPVTTGNPWDTRTWSVTLSSPLRVGQVVTAQATRDDALPSELASATVGQGPINAGESTVEAAPTSVVADGSTTSTITVTVKDGADDGISGVTVVLGQGAGASTIAPASAESDVTNSSGVATFTVKNATAQTVTYTATAQAVPSTAIVQQTITQTAAVTFTEIPVDPAQSSVYIGSDPAATTATRVVGPETTSITVVVRSAEGTLLSGRTVTLAGSATSTISPASATTVDGVATFTVTSNTAGTVTYTATAAGEVLTTRTVAVTFTPDVPATVTLALAAGSTPREVGSFALSGTVVDQFGNAVATSTAVTLNTAATEEEVSGTRSTTTDAGGAFFFALTGEKVGTYSFTATAGSATSTPPLSLTFTVGPVSAAASTVSSPVTVVLGETGSIVVNLTDQYGNPNSLSIPPTFNISPTRGTAGPFSRTGSDPVGQWTAPLATSGSSVGTGSADVFWEGSRIGGGSGPNVSIEVTKAPSTVTVTGAASYTFNGSAQGPTTSTVSNASTGAVTYRYVGVGSTTYDESANRPTNAGTYSVTATLAEDANYFGAESVPFPFEITPRPLDEFDITIADKEYTGSPITLTGADFTFKLKDTETVVALVFGTDYTVVESNNTNAGTATATLTGVGNTSGTAEPTFTITPATVTVTPTADQSKVYGESDPVFTYTTVPAVTLTGALDRETGENVGTYAHNLGNLSGGENYTLVLADNPPTFAITPATLTITAGAQSVDFGTPAATVTDAGTYLASGFVAGEDEEVIGGTVSYTTTYTPTTAAGTAGVTITPVVAALTATNYSFTAAPGTITIVAKSIAGATADPVAAQTYTGAPLTPAVVLKDGGATLAAGTDYTLSYTSNTNVGIATITATGTGNYSGTTSTTFTITPATVTVTPTAGQSKVYGAADPTFTYTASPTLAAGNSFTGALGREAGEDVGTYPYTLGNLSAGANYTLVLAATPPTFAITPATVTISPTAGQSKVFGAADPVFAYTASPTLATGNSFTGALSRAAGENVGTYAYTFGSLSAGANYTLVMAASPSTFAITASTVTIISPTAGQSKVYGAADPVFAYTALPAVPLTGALSRTAGEDVGTYAYTLGNLSAGSNYSLVLADNPPTFAITPATVTIGLQVYDSARVRIAPSSAFRAPLLLDFSSAGSLDFASLTADLAWDPSRLTLDSIRAVATSDLTITTNTADTASGNAALSAFGASGITQSGALAYAYFTAAASTGGTRVRLSPRAAGNEVGTSILSALRPRGVDVCVAPSGRWGDANGDGSVNIIDAQQIARYTVALSVANLAALLERGDVTADGVTNIIDAQQIARFTVLLNAAARIDTPLYTPPVIAQLLVSPDGNQDLILGQTIALAAVALDGSGVDAIGCVPIQFSSANPDIATVSEDGVVTGIATGTATITVTAGARSVSVPVTVVPPYQLSLAAQPTTATSNQLFSAPPVVEVRDLDDALVTVPRSVTASIVSGAGQLSGTTTVSTIGGVATFADLAITGEGEHVLGFSSAGLTGQSSQPISINPPSTMRILVNSQPSVNATAGSDLDIPIILDLSGRNGRNIASITATISWDPALLNFVGTTAGNWVDDQGDAASVTLNTTQTGSGTISITAFTSSGTTKTSTIRTLRLRPTAVGQIGVNATVTVAGDETGQSVVVVPRPLIGTVTEPTEP